MKLSLRSLVYSLVPLALLVTALVPAAAQEDDPPAPEPGILELYVVDDDGDEVFKAWTHILLSEAEKEAKVKASEAGFYSIDTISTDPDGYAELEVPPGEARTLSVSTQGDERPVELELEPFESGETREVEVMLTSKPDLEVTCHVVAAETGKPLAGVRVHSMGSRGRSLGGPARAFRSLRNPETVTDENGAFTLPARSWRPDAVMLMSDDRSPMIVALVESKKAVVFAKPVELKEGATLGGTVVSAQSPLPKGATVHVEIVNYHLHASRTNLSYMGSDWMAVASVDDEGKFLFPNVPSAVPFKLRVEVGRKVIYQEAATRILDAGSDADIEVHLGVGRTIGGVVTEADGTPAADIPIWLMSSEGQSQARIFETYQKPHSVTATGPDGRFAFETIPEGIWHVGLAPKRNRTKASEPADPTLYPAISTVADLTKEPVDIELVVHRGHFIEGLIVAPEGHDTPGSAMVSATNGTQYVNEANIRNGTFRLGPLTPGPWKLTARVISFKAGKDRTLAPSAEVEVEPNGDPVSIQLAIGGGFSAAAYEEGSDTSVPIKFFLMTGAGKWRSLSMQERDKCERWNLEPGTYTAVLYTAEGRYGVGIYEIAEGTELADQKVILGPGGFVDIGYRGTVRYGQVELKQNGVVVGFQTIKSGLRETLVAAPGKATVRVYSGKTGDENAFEELHEIEIIAGETLKLDVTD